jgi:hypothetical protein
MGMVVALPDRIVLGGPEPPRGLDPELGVAEDAARGGLLELVEAAHPVGASVCDRRDDERIARADDEHLRPDAGISKRSRARYQ